MAGHTPGPWVIDATYLEVSDVLGADGYPVAEVQWTAIMPGYNKKFGITHWAGDEGRSYIERPAAEVEANARLIAAAPEMYDAMRLPLLFHSVGAWTDECALEWERITGTKEATTKIMCDAIRALLAKIDGAA